MARPPDERTPEERAAAAAERAARKGAPPPPPQTFAASSRPPDGPDAAAPPPGPEPVATEAHPVVKDPGPVAAEPAPATYEPDPDPVDEEPPEEDPRPTRVHRPAAPDPAARRRSVSAMAARAPHRSRRPPPPRRPPRARRPAQGRPHGRRRAAAVIAFAALLGALYVLYATFQPFHGAGEGSVAVTVPAGANAGAIGDLLAERGVVDSGTFFQVNATVTGRRGKLRPGDYKLRRGMTYGGAIDALVTGPKAKVVKTVNVTVPEGLSVREAAPQVDQGPLEGSYLKAARSTRTMRKVRELGAPRRVDTAEGFLFPATYTLINGAPARNLVDRQLAAFEENFGKVDLSFAQRKNLTRYDVLIIASMVERETQSDKERGLVASVIYNRLSEGIPLGIDATIRYVENNWSDPLRQSELERDGPYNTRLNRGLPPTPIGNPGLASIKAAAKPASSDFIFYVAKPGTCGHAFSSTDAEFAADVARYNAARDAAGGKSPTKC